MKDKIYLVSDKTKASLKIKTFLIKKINITTLKRSNIIVVLGGDGFMLQTLKKLYKLKKPFYGINSGNYGFLMNKFSNKNFLKNLNTDKRPISAVADNFEVRNVKTVIIQSNKKIIFNLLYNKNNSLYKKIKIEQVRKETLIN